MDHVKTILIAACLMSTASINAQGVQILDCEGDSLILCAPDSRIQLPDNNQLIVGAGTPGATSCSAHINLVSSATSDCGAIIQYVVDYYPFDGPTRIRLQDTAESFF